MARKKVSKLIRAIQLFNELDANEQQHLMDYVRSQQPPRKKTAKGSSKKPLQPATTQQPTSNGD